jgi:hypothetical protein
MSRPGCLVVVDLHVPGPGDETLVFAGGVWTKAKDCQAALLLEEDGQIVWIAGDQKDVGTVGRAEGPYRGVFWFSSLAEGLLCNAEAGILSTGRRVFGPNLGT